MDLKEKTYNIRGAIFEVSNTLGAGFLEKVYQEALEIEFRIRGIPYEREKHLTIEYKGHVLQHDYFADFVCYGDIIVELKAVEELCSQHEAQVLNYLSITKKSLGLLVNFGTPKVEIRRFAN